MSYKFAGILTACFFVVLVVADRLGISEPLPLVWIIAFTALAAFGAFSMVWITNLADREAVEGSSTFLSSWRETPQEVRDSILRERAERKERFVAEMRELAAYRLRRMGGGRPSTIHWLRWRMHRRELMRRAEVRTRQVQEERIEQLDAALEEFESALGVMEEARDREKIEREGEDAWENLRENVGGFAEWLKEEEGCESALDAFVRRHQRALWVTDESRCLGERVLEGEENVKLIVGRDLLPNDPQEAAHEAGRQAKAAELADGQGLSHYINLVDYRSTLLVLGDIEEIAAVLGGLEDAGHAVGFALEAEEREDAETLNSLGKGLVGRVSMVPWVRCPTQRAGEDEDP